MLSVETWIWFLFLTLDSASKTSRLTVTFLTTLSVVNFVTVKVSTGALNSPSHFLHASSRYHFFGNGREIISGSFSFYSSLKVNQRMLPKGILRRTGSNMSFHSSATAGCDETAAVTKEDSTSGCRLVRKTGSVDFGAYCEAKSVLSPVPTPLDHATSTVSFQNRSDDDSVVADGSFPLLLLPPLFRNRLKTSKFSGEMVVSTIEGPIQKVPIAVFSTINGLKEKSKSSALPVDGVDEDSSARVFAKSNHRRMDSGIVCEQTSAPAEAVGNEEKCPVTSEGLEDVKPSYENQSKSVLRRTRSGISYEKITKGEVNSVRSSRSHIGDDFDFPLVTESMDEQEVFSILGIEEEAKLKDIEQRTKEIDSVILELLELARELKSTVDCEAPDSGVDDCSVNAKGSASYCGGLSTASSAIAEAFEDIEEKASKQARTAKMVFEALRNAKLEEMEREEKELISVALQLKEAKMRLQQAKAKDECSTIGMALNKLLGTPKISIQEKVETRMRESLAIVENALKKQEDISTRFTDEKTKANQLKVEQLADHREDEDTVEAVNTIENTVRPVSQKKKVFHFISPPPVKYNKELIYGNKKETGVRESATETREPDEKEAHDAPELEAKRSQSSVIVVKGKNIIHPPLKIKPRPRGFFGLCSAVQEVQELVEDVRYTIEDDAEMEDN
jgi:hypothetical protein